MKKWKTIFNVLIAIGIVGICYSSMYFEFNDKTIMSRNEAMRNYNNIVESSFSALLSDVGNIATYYDKYGKDENAVLPNSSYTIKQLIEMYDKQDISSEYNMGDYYGNSDYYDNGRYEDDNNAYSDYLEYSSDYNLQDFMDRNPEYSSTESKAIFNFFCDYSLYKYSSKYMNNIDSNVSYKISYTDVDGQHIEYNTQDAEKILTSNEYKEYFLYDQLNDIKICTLDKQFFTAEIFNSKCKTFTDYNDLYVLMAVNTTYPYDTNLSYYVKDVVTSKKEILKYNIMIVILGLSCVIAGIAGIGLAITTGKNKWKEPAYLYTIDYSWWDLVAVSGFVVTLIINAASRGFYTDEIDNVINQNILKIVLSAIIFVCSEIIVQFVMSIIRRLKAKSLIRTSLLYIVFKKSEALWTNLKTTVKVIIFMIVIITVALIDSAIYSIFYSFGLLVIALLIETVALAVVLWKFLVEYEFINEETDKIASGDTKRTINEKLFFGINRRMAHSVNSIGMGIDKAVDQNVKNERMKTDLITNVSHDIKTPLTSIINYVYLLDQEELENEKAQGYVKILEEKSNRLKILVDDLVEASELSSGTIKLTKTKINLTELIRQSLGEYEEKFEDKKLNIVTNFPEDEVYIFADGRKMWRLLENLYGNIYKYALANTRVYIDANIVGSKVRVEVKNISESQLNFNSDQLTERFIRGDVSRSTEGSGLGLSIAQSIVENHGGTFDIILDGDLFKVIFVMDLIK